jgi:hypothetical protein
MAKKDLRTIYLLEKILFNCEKRQTLWKDYPDVLESLTELIEFIEDALAVYKDGKY